MKYIKKYNIIILYIKHIKFIFYKNTFIKYEKKYKFDIKKYFFNCQINLIIFWFYPMMK